jgi:hypothetical protein
MSDLGSIGIRGGEARALIIARPLPPATGLAYKGCLTRSSPGVGTTPSRLQSLMVGSGQYALGGEDFSVGNPAQPSLRMDASGRWRFRWALTAGSHSIQINVLHAINQNPRPSLVVKANPSIGIPADVEMFAPSGTGWVTAGPIAFVTTALGATWVELRCNLVTNVGMFPCYWDHIVKI